MSRIIGIPTTISRRAITTTAGLAASVAVSITAVAIPIGAATVTALIALAAGLLATIVAIAIAIAVPTGIAVGALLVALARCPALAVATVLLPRPKHLHFVGNDIGRVALDAFLVRVFVSAQLTFDVNLSTLGQIFASDFRQPAEHFDTVPLGAFLLFATLLIGP